jgi:ATP-dependent Clp protease adapter protein ClpS
MNRTDEEKTLTNPPELELSQNEEKILTNSPELELSQNEKKTLTNTPELELSQNEEKTLTNPPELDLSQNKTLTNSTELPQLRTSATKSDMFEEKSNGLTIPEAVEEVSPFRDAVSPRYFSIDIGESTMGAHEQKNMSITVTEHAELVGMCRFFSFSTAS